ncbi:MAG: dihydroorotate dehydrogenase [Calditrichaeota bacterium]|nr:dihydroorotate dehydrogenase [Calditrichota bacterium]
MNPPDLSLTLRNVVFKNPVMVASGTFGYGFEYQDVVDVGELGAVITKSLTLDPRPGTPPPRIVETTGGMLNAIGLANVGLQRFIQEKLPRYRDYPTRVIVNVAGSHPEEYLAIVEALADQPEISGFELNFSCPNVKEGGICIGVDPHSCQNLTAAIRRVTDKPLIVKLTPNVTAIEEIALAAESGGADAVSLINTLVGLAVDIRSWKPRLANVTGGLSGPAIKPVALAQVWQVYQAVQIPIIGIGGIMTVEDALEFLLVGARAIQVGTATFVDPRAANRIVQQLEQYFRENQLQNLDAIVGKMRVES